MIIILSLLCFLTTCNSLPVLLCAIIGLTALIMIFIAGQALMATGAGRPAAHLERKRPGPTERGAVGPLMSQIHVVIFSFIMAVVGSSAGLLIAQIDHNHVLSRFPGVIVILHVVCFTTFILRSRRTMAVSVQRLMTATAGGQSTKGAPAPSAPWVRQSVTIAVSAMILMAIITTVPELLGIDLAQRGPAGGILTGGVFPLLALCLAMDMLTRLLAQRLVTVNCPALVNAYSDRRRHPAIAARTITQRPRHVSRQVIEPPVLKDPETRRESGTVRAGRRSA